MTSHQSRRSLKMWLGLGTAAMISAQASAADTPAQADATPAPGVPPMVQGGEGGEGGEGGVDVARAADEPAPYLEALDVIAAHYLAGRASIALGNRRAGAEMFAHPISEVYVELEPVFIARGVPPFQEAMERASALAFDGAPVAEVNAAVEKVLAALVKAEAGAPPPGPTRAVQFHVAAEMADRAALQYAASLRDPDATEPYLDGYGFARVAAERAERLAAAPAKPEEAEKLAMLKEMLALLAIAYPSPTRPTTTPQVDPGALLAAASRLRLAVE